MLSKNVFLLQIPIPSDNILARGLIERFVRLHLATKMEKTCMHKNTVGKEKKKRIKTTYISKITEIIVHIWVRILDLHIWERNLDLHIWEDLRGSDLLSQ